MFEFNIEERKYKKIHFIGIGGVSMSGIALLLKIRGYNVTGSDRSDSEYLKTLKDHGIEIHIGQKKENITDQDLFVYTDAIAENNEELIAAKATGKEVVTRGVFLGALMKNYKKSIAVSGSHGKSTTTAMIAKILINSANDASILLGGVLDEMEGNVKIGNSEILLSEACEFKGNILNYYPSTVIILNIDEDHLDYYKDLNHIVETFIGYMKNLDENSKAIINIDDVNTHRLIEHVKGEVITFGLERIDANYFMESVEYNEVGHPTFKLNMKDGSIEEFELHIAGIHNIYNAISAIIASYENGISIEEIKAGLKAYKSLHRRMETVGDYNGAVIMTDYGHHPVEIQTTLKTIDAFTDKNIITVFQPHTFSRTKALLDDFADSFYDSDEVIVTDIFPAREEFDPTIHSKDLVEKLIQNGVNAKYIADFEDAKEYLQSKICKDDLVLTTGCGNPHVLAKMIVKE
ncbi:UDP-N-acetylmuramate--L-alanine ligase [Helcococcus kunzii]|uniref:UDP-N-acetylmuramate--L-alanine ligase n=1 Tax=Helcococcus kunzii TaxID=40091 RepID=UPI00389D77C7